MREYTFDLETCRDLLDKLDRELKRIRGTNNRLELADHGYNFAITAWHISEWAWAAMDHKYDLKIQIAKAIDISPAKLSFAGVSNLRL